MNFKIKEGLYGVGVIDNAVRVFHGYETPVGTTYNAYIQVDEKITLIDTVKGTFAIQLLENIKSVLGERTIDYIIVNHAEPDHSGSIVEVLQQYPAAKLYGTSNCEKAMKIFYPSIGDNFNIVKAGDTLCTGKKTFEFCPMPMIHWPDSMATYLQEDKILFSNDAFGQHTGLGHLFDTDLGLMSLIERAGDYYANIVLPYSPQVAKLLDTLSSKTIDMICPAHGVILTEHAKDIVQKYSDWSNGITDEKLVSIIYDTMWGTTDKIAKNLYNEYTAKGFHVKLLSLSSCHYSNAMSHLLESKYIFVGSSTLNNNMLPTVIAFLTYMKGLKPKNRVGLAFGSYGWSGESIPQIEKILTECGFDMLPSIKTIWNI